MSPPVAASRRGRNVSLACEPAACPRGRTGTLAVAMRRPDAVASGGRGYRSRAGAHPARSAHLQWAGPADLVLAPPEGSGRLYRIGLPGVLGETSVGRQPRDAAPATAGRGSWVTSSPTLSPSSLPTAPRASSLHRRCRRSGVVARRFGGGDSGGQGRQIQAYAPDGRSFGTALCGRGPAMSERVRRVSSTWPTPRPMSRWCSRPGPAGFARWHGCPPAAPATAWRRTGPGGLSGGWWCRHGRRPAAVPRPDPPRPLGPGYGPGRRPW